MAQRCKFSSPELDPPCKTNGQLTASANSCKRSKLILGVPLYNPWAVPIDTAKLSTLVWATKSLASETDV